MKKLFFVIFIINCLFSAWLFSQEDSSIEVILENFETEEIHQTDFLQVLKDLEANPINVNSAGIKELLRIPFLNQHLSRQIIHYRNQNGKYSDKSALLSVPGINSELLDAISPLINFRTVKQIPVIDYRMQLGRQLHSIRAYQESDEAKRYENPIYLYHRLRFKPNPNLSIGALWEKDAGESNWFDFGSFYFRYQWIKAKSVFQIGDFNIEAGQRLLFSGSYGLPLTVGSSLPFTQTPIRWRAKSASDENAFLRGVLWDYSPSSNTSIIVAYSNHALDATLTTEDSVAVRSLYSPGYHRTETEMNKENRVKENVLAGIVTTEFNSAQLGFQAAHSGYSLPIKIEENTFRQKFAYFSGFYSLQKKDLKLQGEGSFMEGKFPALQQTILLRSPKRRLTYGALFYYYHPEYWAFHGRAFGKTSDQPSNELGYFLSISARVFDKTNLSLYFHASRPIRELDKFAFLKRTRQFQLDQRIQKSRLMLRFTQRIRKGSSSNKFALEEQKSQSLRFHLSSNISPKLRLSHRVEVSWADSSRQTEKNHGISFYQDIRYRINKYFIFQARWTQFEIPDFDFRLYEFENDLPGNFRNVLLNNRGFKWFVLINYKVYSNWKFALKYREIYYPDEETLGSGLSTVLGNRKKELRFQFQVFY